MAVLGMITLLRYATDVLVLSAESARLLEIVTSVVLAVFVLAGALQLLLFARGVRQREGIVAKSSEDVERSADAMTRAAEELDRDLEPPGEQADAGGDRTGLDAADERPGNDEPGAE